MEKETEKEIEKITHCQKDVEHGKAICSVKLDCHLHDWRQHEELEYYKRTLQEELDKMYCKQARANGIKCCYDKALQDIKDKLLWHITK